MNTYFTKEEIICAAIWYKDIKGEKEFQLYHHPINIDKGVVLCGHRHGHIITQMSILTGKRSSETGNYVQGFLTSKNRFIDRYEARELFIQNGGKPEFEQLYSEDLY